MSVVIDWQLPDFVHNALDNPQNLDTVLTITGDPTKAYACSCEEYVKFVWAKNNSIVQFIRAIAGSEFICSTEARKHCEAAQEIFRSSQLTIFAHGGSSTSSYGSKMLTFQTIAEKGCLIDVCECLSWLAAVCRPPKQGNIYASSAVFEKLGGNDFALRADVLQSLTLSDSTSDVDCCWLNMFDGGYILAQGFPCPQEKPAEGLSCHLK